MSPEGDRVKTIRARNRALVAVLGFVQCLDRLGTLDRDARQMG